MKIFFSLLLVLFLFHQKSFSQTCNCAQEFQYVKEKIEKNYAGFVDKVNSKNKADYDRVSKQILERSKKVSAAPYCIALMEEWLRFFKDGHVEIGRNRMSKEKYAEDLKRLVQGIENLDVKTSDLTRLEQAKNIEGVYWSSDSTYKIALVKSANSLRDYAGVVLESKNVSWKPGNVKLELKLRRDSLKGIEFDKYYTPQSVAIKVQSNTLGDWQRAGTERIKIDKIQTTDVSSKVLSDQTFYIQIGTFNQRNAKNIDSMIKANQNIIAKTPNLIIDLRNNGGGADFSYQPLVPYLYTNPIKSIGANILSSADNVSGWEALLKMNDIPDNQKVFIREKIALMNEHKGKFVEMGKDTEIVMDHITAFPKKIVVLINKGCGSTTEEFLFAAKQSKKVTLMGVASAGVLDYANVRDISFSCMPYALHYATTRSRRLDIGQGIDNIGIKPDVNLTPAQNWVKEAQSFLEK